VVELVETPVVEPVETPVAEQRPPASASTPGPAASGCWGSKSAAKGRAPQEFGPLAGRGRAVVQALRWSSLSRPLRKTTLAV